MTDFNRSLTVVCPTGLLDSANHMANCFESCYPSQPVFNAPADPEATHVEINVACRESWLQNVQGIVAAWQNEAARPAVLSQIMPGWNQYVTDDTGENGYWLVDEANVTDALNNTVLADPEGEMPEGKIVLYPG